MRHLLNNEILIEINDQIVRMKEYVLLLITKIDSFLKKLIY